MTSAICTLFEGDYHFGMAALVNSLSAFGFKGTVYAGYRGPLPPWASATSSTGTLNVTPEIAITFVPLATTIHLTNYKPVFMLNLWENHCPDAAALFYFDPDIVIKCRWSFFEEWAEFGVALCRDINGDMPNTHPLRQMWRRILQPLGIPFHRSSDVYVNGGFVGVSRKQHAFVDLWRTTLSHMENCSTDLSQLGHWDRSLPFAFPDQDALNVACMAHTGEVSIMGSEGMDFQWGGGGYVMSHAAGGVKPWRKKMLLSLLTRAVPPSRADQNYYRFTQKPIQLYTPTQKIIKRLDLKMASALARLLG